MVKVKEVKHSDEELSSDGVGEEEYGEEEEMYGDESGEMEFHNPWEDMAEEGEVEMDDYDEEEEGELDMEEDGEMEEHDMDAIIKSNKEMVNIMKELKNYDEAPA